MSSLFPSNVKLGLLVVLISCLIVVSASDLHQDFGITWGNGRGQILNNGELITLTLDNTSGSGFESKREYLFGKIDMQIKLVPGNSAGTVTAYYLSSQGSSHDEIDFEFLGNLTGEPYTVHTNVYTQGKVVFSVDNVPIREFKNLESIGVPYPKSQPMKLYSSIWNADEWATRGGLIKTDWSKAPFTASYRNFNVNSCTSSFNYPSSSCKYLEAKLDPLNEERLRWVQRKYMIYNYCTDAKRFPQGFPPECSAR